MGFLLLLIFQGARGLANHSMNILKSTVQLSNLHQSQKFIKEHNAETLKKLQDFKTESPDLADLEHEIVLMMDRHGIIIEPEERIIVEELPIEENNILQTSESTAVNDIN